MTYLLILLAFTPLVYFGGSVVFPYVSDKVLFLRLIVSVVSVWFFVRLLINSNFRDRVANRLSAIGLMGPRSRPIASGRGKHMGLIGLMRPMGLISRINPIFLSVCLYFFFFILSAIFAVDKFSAFYGTVERGEGVVGMVFLFGFFVFASLLFGKKQWLWFFGVTLLAAVILFGHALLQALAGQSRPSAFTGNPVFLAAYFLFPVLAGVAVWAMREPMGPIGHIGRIGLIVAALSLVGVFLANSRGVVAGVVVGVLACLLVLVLDKTLNPSRSTSRDPDFYAGPRIKSGVATSQRVPLTSLAAGRRSAMVVLIILVALSGIFFATKKNALWQRIPVLSRLSQVSFSASAISGRLYYSQVALKAVNPGQNGYKKFLLGWGPENFLVAASAYYDPHYYYDYEYSLYDRVHNQLLDVLVASGLLGLVSYLAIWFFVLRFLLIHMPLRASYQYHPGPDPGSSTLLGHVLDPGLNPGWGLRLSLLFFATAYFVQNLFAFDNVVTYIPFFAFLAFVVFLGQEEHDSDPAVILAQAGIHTQSIENN